MQNSFEGFIMKKIKKKLKIMTTLFLTSVLITFSIIVHIINSKQSSLGFKKKKKKKKKPNSLNILHTKLIQNSITFIFEESKLA